VSGPSLVLTGATGFVGEHVARAAKMLGYSITAVGREPSPSSGLARLVDDYMSADLTRGWPAKAETDAVIHLAGLAAVGPSYDSPQRYIEMNSRMVTAMCESILDTGRQTRLLVVSSGAVYAPGDDGLPIDEESPTAPTSPYAVSKLLVEMQAAYYAYRGLDITVARPFNHIGPRQDRGFLVPDLVYALGLLAPGQVLSVGNLDTARDYTDVRDVASAYLAIVSAPERRHSIYNVASGVSRTGREILATVASVLGIPVPTVEVDARRIRPGDPARITGSARRLRDEFGWSPTFDLRSSILDFVSTGGLSDS
jgi:GDP-4-dehydro-6-deoxy-D-mannose reductase